MKRLLTTILILQFSVALAQEYFPKNDGVKTPDNGYTAFTEARIIVRPGEIIDNGTLLIHKGKVVEAGKQVTILKNSVIVNLKGKSIYPSFIDVYSGFGLELPPVTEHSSSDTQYDSKRQGYYWNEHVMPENSGDMERMNGRNLPFYAGTVTSYGISDEEALSMISLNPAKILGIDKRYGSLEKGKSATLFISEGNPLDMRTNQLVRAYIDGREISLETHQTEHWKRYMGKYESQAR